MKKQIGLASTGLAAIAVAFACGFCYTYGVCSLWLLLIVPIMVFFIATIPKNLLLRLIVITASIGAILCAFWPEIVLRQVGFITVVASFFVLLVVCALHVIRRSGAVLLRQLRGG
jgi:hypothetical protein